MVGGGVISARVGAGWGEYQCGVQQRGSSRKIREQISVISGSGSSSGVMVQTRFKAGAKNISASLPPLIPSHSTTSTRHEIEVNHQSRLFLPRSIFHLGWKLPLGVSGQFLYRIRKQKSIFNYLWAFCVTASLGQCVFRSPDLAPALL